MWRIFARKLEKTASPRLLLTGRNFENQRWAHGAGGAGWRGGNVVTTEQGYEVRCDLHQFDNVLHALEDAGLRTESAEIAYIPTTLVPVTDVGLAKTLIHLHESLDEDDDVQQVFSNEEVDDAVSEAATQPT